MRVDASAIVLGAAALAAACATRIPETHYYELAGDLPVLPRPAAPVAAAGVLTIEPLEVNASYDTERIAYSSRPHRLDFYHYHRWSALPSQAVRDYLCFAYAATGRFQRVTAELTAETDAVLSGRLARFEEVDRDGGRWFARLVLELRLRGRGDQPLWWDTFVEQVALDERSPEGLARAMSRALASAVSRSASSIQHHSAAARRLRQQEEQRGAGEASASVAPADLPDSGPGVARR